VPRRLRRKKSAACFTIQAKGRVYWLNKKDSLKNMAWYKQVSHIETSKGNSMFV
jgi:hypothetical protein